MRYGLPYQGSKNAIAKKICDILPLADNFYDLFAGGCAITHYVLLNGGYKHIYYNDIDNIPQLFLKAIKGDYANEKRWISREDFERLKNDDLYVSLFWSFGNNRRGYLYSKEIEPWKKALHYARVFNDFSEFGKFGIKTNGSRKDIQLNNKEYKEKYIKWYYKNVLKSDLDPQSYFKSLTNQISKNKKELHYFMQSLQSLESLNVTKNHMKKLI